MHRTDFGAFSAAIPIDWTIRADGNLVAVHPPFGGAVIQVSTYTAPAGHVPAAGELWDFAEPSLDPEWGVTEGAVREETPGFALDAEGPTDIGGVLMAWRLWPGRLLFATFFYEPEDASLAVGARRFMASIGLGSTQATNHRILD